MRCEEFVNQYLPTVKAEIVHVLYNEYDLNQVEISEILDITQPAVSQYLQGLRGGEKELGDELIEKIKEVSEELYELKKADKITPEKIDELMCEICKSV
ncbi:MAG: transcriptional regulator [Candidatus Thermoplasmatota archaeon]|nr:transcriptional regulator [Candidatus Thermoplasmatota archaeon]